MPALRPSTWLAPPASPGDVLVVELPGANAVELCRDCPRTVALRFGSNQHRVAVPTSPGAVMTIIDDAAALAGRPVEATRSAVLDRVVSWEPALAWVHGRPDALALALGAFVHPLLDHPYREGREALREFPGWASELLRHQSVHSVAVDLASGPRNNRLIRVVAESLVAHAFKVDIAPLGFAVAAKGLVSVDEMANVVEAATGRVDCPYPTPDEVQAIRAGLAVYPAERRARLLGDVARNHTPERLVKALVQFGWIVHRIDGPRPMRLSDLETLCARYVPVLAPPAERAPAPPLAPAEPPPVVATPRPRRVSRQVGTDPRPAPLTNRRAPSRWSIPRALRGVHGHLAGQFRLAVPTSSTELSWWGRQLDNCLGDYSAAACEELSWLVGIQLDDTVIGCVEVNPATRRIRQILGRKNRRLPQQVYDTVVAALIELRVLQS